MASTSINSKGTLGLSHYRSSRVSTSKMEPIYLNQFTVQLLLDPNSALATSWQESDLNVVLEGVKNVNGLPSINAAGGTQSQTYKFATRRFASGKPDKTTADIQINWQLNLAPAGDEIGGYQNYTYRFLRQWSDLIYDPLTGRQGLKREYAANQMIVTMHDRAGTPFWQWTFYSIFPTAALPAPNLDYTADGLFDASQTFAADYWDEAML